MKAKKPPPDYTVMKDDGDMIARMVQECLIEYFNHVAHHRDKLQKELLEMGELLKKFREAQFTSSSRGTKPSTTQTTEKVEGEERDPVLLMPHAHSMVYIKPSMLRMDEIVGHTPLKDLDHIQLVLTQMP
jgi:hypothetical protein